MGETSKSHNQILENGVEVFVGSNPRFGYCYYGYRQIRHNRRDGSYEEIEEKNIVNYKYVNYKVPKKK